MIVDYSLYPYLALASILIAAGIAVWKGYSAAKTLGVLIFAVYLPALFCVEFLPFSFVEDEMLSQDMGMFPCPFSFIAQLLTSSNATGMLGAGLTLLKMTAVLVPFGLILPALFSSCRSTRRGICVIAVTAIGIELFQVFENALMRSCSKRISFDEALLAFLGGVLGYLISKRIISFREKRAKCLTRG